MIQGKLDSTLVYFCFAIFVYFIVGCSSGRPLAAPAVPLEPEARIPANAPLIKFSRYISLQSCDRKKRCLDAIVKDAEKSNVVLALEPFAKSYSHGLTAVDQHQVQEGDLPFRSEIRVSKTTEGYYVYMMLKSGPETVRTGRVKTFRIPDFSNLSEVAIEDEPVATRNGTLRAQLVMGPPQPVDLGTR